MWVDIQNVITYPTFGDDRLRGLGVARGRISRFPIDLRRRPYNTVALPCECVIFHTPVAQYSLFMLKLPVSTNQPTNIHAHNIRTYNQILHGDQARCEESFYMVDHEC